MRVLTQVSQFYTTHWRAVSTWTPLTTAFNSKPGLKLNLSLSRNNAGLFGVSELQTHEGFYALKERAEWHTEKLITESCSPESYVKDRVFGPPLPHALTQLRERIMYIVADINCQILGYVLQELDYRIDVCCIMKGGTYGTPIRSRRMVEIFDELSDTLCKVADLAEFIRIAHPRASFAQAAEDACISISSIVEKLNTHRELYNALRSVVEVGDRFPTTSVDKHVARLFLFDFEQSGIHLAETDRRKVVQLNDNILHYGQRFMAGTAAPRTVPKNSLPQNLRHLFITEGDNILVTGLYADSPNVSAREAAYRIFLYPDVHQEYLLNELLKARHELALLCGFPTYSHRALKASVAESPEMVTEFLEILSEELRDKATKDFEIMKLMKIAESTQQCKELASWDTPYFTQKAKRDWLKVAASEFSPFFSLGACMEGLNIIMNSLYGISLVNDEVFAGEVWAPDVYKLAVTHESEGLLGHIYCDFYERSGKPNQDCHFTIRGGKEMPDGSYQSPIVVLMLNLPSPTWTSPSLLTPGMVDNLFHEMGHAMHSMLARTKYQHVTGTRCSTDFAEVPSVLMEFFAADPRVLRTFARHYRTQESMPEDMLTRLCASKHLFVASEMQVQVFYSALDQVYHGYHPLPGSTTDVLAETQGKYYGIPFIANTAWQLRFSHLVGYGAKYYSYLLSRALASWIWQSYFEADPFSRSAGERYRYECLAHGGGKPPRQLVAHFLGREVTPANLAKSLISEIVKKDNKEHLTTHL